MERDAFFARLRSSLASGRRGEPPAEPESYRRPPEVPRDERVTRLTAELEAAGGVVHRAGDEAAARRVVAELLAERGVRQVIRGTTPQVEALGLDAELEGRGMTVTSHPTRDAAFAADAGVTSAEWGVAETGTLALLASPGQERSLSLLPPLHVAVLESGDVVWELDELFERVAAEGLPSALTFVTGPSKTGDIELVLTVGVHGPKELHLVLIG